MTTAIQTSAMPTRKLMVGALTAGVIGPAFAEAWASGLVGIAPWAVGPAMVLMIETLITTGCAIAAAYWVKDAPNVPA